MRAPLFHSSPAARGLERRGQVLCPSEQARGGEHGSLRTSTLTSCLFGGAQSERQAVSRQNEPANGTSKQAQKWHKKSTVEKSSRGKTAVNY